MIQYESIRKALGVDIAVSPEMAESIYRWQRMYRNKPPWISKDVKGLNLPAAISSEFARLVTNEARIEVSGSPRADLINEMLTPFRVTFANTWNLRVPLVVFALSHTLPGIRWL